MDPVSIAASLAATIAGGLSATARIASRAKQVYSSALIAISHDRNTSPAGPGADADSDIAATSSSLSRTPSLRSYHWQPADSTLMTEELKKSRAYKAQAFGCDSDSGLSKDTHNREGDRWSKLSDLSLGDRSTSNIGVLELPLQGRLHKAICSQNIFVLQTLLKAGADVDKADSDSFSTPLVYLCKSTTEMNDRRQQQLAEDICMLLLQAKAKVDLCDRMGGRTPLSYAASWHVGLCRLLLASGADVNTADASGRTPLSYAVVNDHSPSLDPELCKVLLDYGAAVDEMDLSGRTPLFYAANNEYVETSASSTPDPTVEVCRLLLDHGATLDFRDSKGRTPLSYAISNEKIKRQAMKTKPPLPGNLCTLLLDRGADLYKIDSSGRTPLDYARLTGSFV